MSHDSVSDTEKQNKETTESSIVGGFAFFLSLAVLAPLGFLFFVLSVAKIKGAETRIALAFIGSCIFGALLAHSMIRDHLSVFLHEFKHALIALLVGNKYKGMKIGRKSGHMQYAYTKKTAHYNAFISLAPYIVPLCTIVAVVLTLLVTGGDPLFTVILIGLGYGADLLLNARDISPVQTDISLIRGGYLVGLLYIFSWNLLTTAIILAWAFKGSAGVSELFTLVSEVFFAAYFYLSGTTPNG